MQVASVVNPPIPEMEYDVVDYHSVPITNDAHAMYNITHTKILPPPVMHCKALKGVPCEAGKTSYWRSFALNMENGGCGETKKICGATPFPSPNSPYYVMEPAHRDDIIKFL